MAIYVDNKAFLEALIQYRKDIRIAKREALEKPKVPEFVGECILKIAQHLSFKPNFLNYSYREDMVGDAVENCLLYIDNFNPAKSKNPFSYFTQISFYAFVRRILREKKQLYVKYKCIQNSSEFESYVNQEHDDKDYDNTYIEFLRRNMGEIITDFETKKKVKKRKQKPKGLEVFMK